MLKATQQRKTLMVGKLQNNQKGFGVVEGILILVIVGILGFTGWYVWHANNNASKSQTSNNSTTPAVDNKAATSKTTTQAPTDPYAGWSKAMLTRSKLTFRYPSSWTLKSISNGGVNNSSVDNIDVKSPVANGHYFDISLQEGPSNTQINLNMLGNASGSTISKLDVKGSSQQLYLDSQTGASQGTIRCLGLATTPGNQNHDTAFGILDDNAKGSNNIVMYACLTPDTATLNDNGVEYSTSAYTSNPYYDTVIKIFQSLYYAQ